MIYDNPKDKNGVPIEEFDVLKVFHFIGSRRKKHYMYKMAVLYHGKLHGAHLDKNPLEPNYPLYFEDMHMHTEIVESRNWEKLK